MKNFIFRSGDLCWRTSGGDPNINARLVVVCNSHGFSSSSVSVVPTKHYINYVDYYLSVVKGNLIFIKGNYSRVNTNMEYRKADGQVHEYHGNPAIAFENLYIDGRKIAIHYLVGDDKVWIPVI